uniref:Uncharacterized protein n=1 Tax=Pyrodinium bahamense TaxID=73915 RepID=A0A7S0B3M8_9DINO
MAAHIRGIPRGWDGEVYDIPLINLFFAVALIAWGSIIGSVGIVVLATLKLVPAVLRTLYEYVVLLKDLQPWWWLFWFCGLALVLAACPLVYGLVVCYGFASGPRCAIEALTSASIVSGFLEVVRILREFDMGSNIFILHYEKSCVPRVRERPIRQAMSRMFVNRPEDSLQEVWDVFFQECTRTARRAVANQWLLAASLDALDPAVIIGVPALCTFDTLYRSALEAPGERCICWPSSTCEEKSRPRNSIADTFWPKLMACKDEIGKHLPLADDELLYLRVKLCAGGGEVDALGSTAKAVLAKERPRSQDLHGICAEFTRLSLELSRLGEMQRRFPNMVAAVTGGGTHRGDVPAPEVLGFARDVGLESMEFQEFALAMALSQEDGSELSAGMTTPGGTQAAPGGTQGQPGDVDLPGFVSSTPRDP